MSTKKTTPRQHIIVKVLQMKDKEKNLLSSQKKRNYFQKRTIKLTVDS